MVSLTSHSERNIGQSEWLEDYVYDGLVRTGSGEELHVLLVADGGGGGGAGEQAARTAARAIIDYIEQSGETVIPALLIEAVEAANEVVYNEMHGEGTTTVALVAIGMNDPDAPHGRMFIASVGDSYIGIMREGQFQRLNIDHTLANEYYYAGQISESEAMRLENGSYPTRILGVNPEIQVDIGFYVEKGNPFVNAQRAFHIGSNGLVLREGDTVLVASDGAFRVDPDTRQPYIPIDELLRFALDKDVEHAVQNLLRIGINRQPDDNIALAMLFVPSRMRRPVRTQRLTPRQRFGIGVVVTILLVFIVGLAVSLGQSQGEVQEAQRFATQVQETRVVIGVTETEIRVRGATATQEQATRVVLQSTATVVQATEFQIQLEEELARRLPAASPLLAESNAVGFYFERIPGGTPNREDAFLRIGYEHIDLSYLEVFGEDTDDNPRLLEGQARVFLMQESEAALNSVTINRTESRYEYDMIHYPPNPDEDFDSDLFANNHLFQNGGATVRYDGYDDPFILAEAQCMASKRLLDQTVPPNIERIAFTCFEGECHLRFESDPDQEREFELTPGVRWVLEFDRTTGELVQEPQSGSILYSELQRYYDAVRVLRGSDEEARCLLPILDEDNDTVFNPFDECRNVPGSAEHEGCPDSDGDGFFDNEDLCPDQPAPDTQDGCPRAPTPIPFTNTPQPTADDAQPAAPTEDTGYGAALPDDEFVRREAERETTSRRVAMPLSIMLSFGLVGMLGAARIQRRQRDTDVQ